jgi:hypothetical protein
VELWPSYAFDIWHIGGKIVPGGFDIYGKREVLQPPRKSALQRNLDAIYELEIAKTLADRRTIYVGRGTDMIGWGSFGIFEGFKASQLRADNGMLSIYEQADVNAGCKWKRSS